MSMDSLIKNAETINGLLARYGVKFGIYKNGEFKEQLFPFDPIPRVIGRKEFDFLPRVTAYVLPRAYTAIFQALISFSQRTTTGTFWKTTCVCRPVPPIL